MPSTTSYLRQRRDAGARPAAAHADGDRRRRHRRRIRHHLLRARRAGDADRAAQHHPRLRRSRDRRRFHPPDARPRHDIRLGSAVKEIDGHERLRAGDAGRRPLIRSQIVLYAAGRTGNVGSLGLDAVGIEADSARPHQGRPADLPDDGAATSMPPATSSAFRASPRPSMEQGRVAACHAFGVHAAAAARDVSLWHLRRAGDLDRRPVGRAGARERHLPTRSAWRVSARPRAATSWASTPAS